MYLVEKHDLRPADGRSTEAEDMAEFAVAHLAIEHFGRGEKYVRRGRGHAASGEDDFFTEHGGAAGGSGAVELFGTGSDIGGSPDHVTVTLGAAQKRADESSGAWCSPALMPRKVCGIAWGRPEEGADGQSPACLPQQKSIEAPRLRIGFRELVFKQLVAGIDGDGFRPAGGPLDEAGNMGECWQVEGEGLSRARPRPDDEAPAASGFHVEEHPPGRLVLELGEGKRVWFALAQEAR